MGEAALDLSAFDEFEAFDDECIAEFTESLEQDIAQECRLSLFTFVQEMWEVIIEEEPIWNWHIPFICTQLEKAFYSVVTRQKREHDIIINIPPGTTKSTIVTVMFQAWSWIAELPRDKFPEFYKRESLRRGIPVDELHIRGDYLRFITGSYAEKLSIEHSEYALTIIQSDKYRSYFPELKIKKKKQAKSNFVNTKKGQRFTTSVGATVTGVHAHFIVIDDPIDPNKAISDKERITANHWTDHTLSTRKVDKRVTITILIMQRIHMDDPTGHMVEARGKKIKQFVLPATTEYEVKPPYLAEFYTDGHLDPVRMDDDVLQEARTTLGSYGYAGQFGQNPIPREGALFQEDWFEIVPAVPTKIEKTVRGWDLAATSEAESAIKGVEPAYTASVKMSRAKDGTYYIEHASRRRLGPRSARRSMKNYASQDGKDVMISIPQDPGQAGKDQAREIVSFLSGFNARASLESGDKLTRLEPFSAQCEAGNVKLVKGSWNKTFLSELCLVPNGKFWDQADAAGRAFSQVHIPSGKQGGGW